MKRTLTNLFRSKNQKRRPKSKALRPSFESLEDRRVMAVSAGPVIYEPVAYFAPAQNSPAAKLVAGINEGTLYIRGTDAADTITLRQKNNEIKIDGLTGAFNTNYFQNIVVRSFGGNDKINLKSEAVKGQQAITKATESVTDAIVATKLANA